MKDLPTPAEIAAVLDFDPAVGSFTWKPRQNDARNWNFRCAGKIAGNVDAHGYRRISIGNRKFWAHRLAWRLMTGEQPAMVDHINGNRDDNRFANLRAADNAENLQNRGMNARNSSGFKGVHLSRAAGRYAAQIMARGRRYTLGLFDTAEEAAAAYAAAAAKHHGNFANSGQPAA